jgi:sortase A
LFTAGLVLVSFFGAARIESFFASRAALEKFAALETPSDVTDPGPEEDAHPGGELAPSGPMNLPGVDFRLWNERRVNAYKRNIGKRSGGPLAVLSIPKIGLEVPLFDGADEITLNHGVGRIV